MNEYATSTSPAELRIERKLPGPIERVWEYLVDPGKRALWFCGGEAFEPKVGAKLVFTFDHSKLSHEPTPEEWKGFEGASASGVITHYDPPLVFGYKGSWEGGEEEVLFELTPMGSEVLLAITQKKVADAQAKANYGTGWHAHLTILEARLQGREPPGFWTLFHRLQKEYASRF